MTRALIQGAAPLHAWRDFLRLVLTTVYPFHTFINTPIHRIRLWTLKGRQRSYPCRVDEPRAPKARTRREPTPPRSPSKPKSPARSAGSSRASSPKPKSPPVTSGGITRWPSPCGGRRGSPDKTRNTKDAALPYTAPLGLHKPGVYCYRRAVLQCLLHLPALYNELVVADVHAACEVPEGECVACAFKEFVFRYWHDRSLENLPRGDAGGVRSALDEAVNAGCPASSTFSELENDRVQGDAFALFEFLFDQVKEQDEELYQAVDRLFQVTHQITRMCPHCGGQEVTHEANMGLRLSVRKCREGEAMTLLDYLDEFHCETVPFTCETEACNQRRDIDLQLGVDSTGEVDAARTFAITDAPAALAINLTRVQSDAKCGRAFKVTDDVEYNELLDLTDFTADGEPLKYRLYGVVSHMGEDVMSGYWIASVRHRNGTAYRTISDGDVEFDPEVGFGELKWPTFNREEYDATVLLYLKVEDDES